MLGLNPKTTGASLLEQGKKQLFSLYPHVEQLDKEKVNGITSIPDGFTVITNKNFEKLYRTTSKGSKRERPHLAKKRGSPN